MLKVPQLCHSQQTPVIIYAFEDVLVCDLVLMALLTLLFLSLSTEHVVFLCVTCPCSFWTKRHANLLANNNNNNNNNNNMQRQCFYSAVENRVQTVHDGTISVVIVLCKNNEKIRINATKPNITFEIFLK